MTVDLKDGPIDPEADKYQAMLCNLQGNILKPHGRKHAVHIFLKFTAGEDAVRKWMRDFAVSYVTSAKKQRIQAKQLSEPSDPKEPGTKETLFSNLFLSATGYGALGYKEEWIQKAFAVDEEAEKQHLPILDFRKGMAEYANLLGDPSPEDWEWAYRDRKIDAMILLAHAEVSQLLDHMCKVLGEVAAVAHVLTVELGNRLYNANKDSVEPFGYRDGISQPVFLDDGSQSVPPVFDPSKLEFSDSTGKPSDNWTPLASLNLVLLPDPFTLEGKDYFGSYLVFRKLEQNVRGFHQSIRGLAGKLEREPEWAQALVLGRFRDGSPLGSSGQARVYPSVIEANRFDYAEDRLGARCPFQAHIRRLNPRHESAAHRKGVERKREIVEAERGHRIARRGIPYGTLPEDYLSSVSLDEYPIDQVDELPEHGVGILFMCFQRSLSNQFGYLQMVWANSESRSAGTQVFVGLDPIAGQSTGSQSATPNANCPITMGGGKLSVEPLWPKKWDEQPSTPLTFQGSVRLKGGEFLFAPSLHFLENPWPPDGDAVKG